MGDLGHNHMVKETAGKFLEGADCFLRQAVEVSGKK